MNIDGSRPTLLLGLMIGLWWCGSFYANFLLSGNKKLVEDERRPNEVEDLAATTSAKLWWVELTALQHVTGSILLTIIARLLGRSVWSSATGTKMKFLFMAGLGHCMGTLASNAAHTVVTSDVAIIVGACQPLFTILLLSKRGFFSVKFLSVLVIVVGVVVLQMGYINMFDLWGLLATAVSTLAFSARNILLKGLYNNLDGPLETFAVVSSLSAVLSLPLWGIKAAITGSILTSNIVMGSGASLLFVHSAYSLSSLKVLEMVSPVTHAIATICIHLLSSFENVARLAHVSLSWSLVDVIIVVVGFYLYRFGGRYSVKKILLILLSLVILRGNSSIARIYDGDTARVYDKPITQSMEKRFATAWQYDKLKITQRSNEKRISTAWLYDKPITQNVITNIGNLAQYNPTMKVYVYCGTTQCVHEAAALEKENVTVEFAVISDIVRGTPLEEWVANHLINKLLTGLDFETHLHEVTILGILWHYGGFYVNPLVRIVKGKLPEYHNMTVVSEEMAVPNEDLPSVFDVSYFPKYHPVIKQLVEMYLSKYPTVDDGPPSNFKFIDTVWKAKCIEMQCFDRIYRGGLKDVGYGANRSSHYGVLLHPALDHSNGAIDDEMENFAGVQYLPFVDSFIERNDLRSFSRRDGVTAFLNGKWGVSKGTLLSSLNPIMLSVHLESGAKSNWSEHLGYLRAQEPIGCRGAGTLDHLQANGVQSFAPSSLMLLMKNPNPGSQERLHIYFAELKEENAQLLPDNILETAVNLTRNPKMQGHDITTLSKAAYRIIEKFKSAKLVITENLQYALCCVALETPVIFIDTRHNEVERYKVPATTASLVHVVDTNKPQAKEWFQRFPWNNIPPNPNPAMLMRLRATSWNVIRRNQHLYDAATRFGVVPMSPPLSLQNTEKLVFYLIFTTSMADSVEVFESSKKQSGQFNWKHWRSVESIFYHHPTAQVSVYSNTLPENTFNVLTEAGYSIQVHKYNLESLLISTPAEGFIKKLGKARGEPNWYSNSANLLRMLLLYQLGGIYMDTDIFIVQPLHSLKMNTVAWQEPLGRIMNSAFMKFEKNNLFLEECLKEFAETYRGDIWGYNGPAILSRVYRRSEWSRDVINVVNYKYFYMIEWSNMIKQCFTDTGGSTFDSNLQILNTEAYVVHTNSKVTGVEGIQGGSLKNGTICHHLLTAYCVLCDQIH